MIIITCYVSDYRPDYENEQSNPFCKQIDHIEYVMAKNISNQQSAMK